MKISIKTTPVFVLILTILVFLLWNLPTGFEQARNEKETIRCKGKVIKIDNSTIRTDGVVKSGSQEVTVNILDGKFKGQVVKSNNLLTGKLELDKFFQVGDKALIVVQTKDNKIIYSNVIDHYRINLEFILLCGFCFMLILLAGWTGIKSIISFIFTILVIWKILLPGFLKGYDPIITSMIVVILLTFVIIFLVAGFTKKGVVAFIGAVLGEILTCILAITFGKAFNIHGAVLPFSEALLYSGFLNLDLTKIFFSGIFLASSGAVMDVAMDISASLNEVINKKPEITTKDAILSGINVSKAIIGTMTTTLLLAYSGGYIAMLMMFIAQGTPVINILNITYVSSEILHTLVGSFGLVMVAPFTAVVGGLIYTKK